jgi:endonuclease YncB( thermonuclease family)
MPHLLTLLLLATAPAAVAQTARVVEGDTLAIGDQRIRLLGIDSPEGSQVCQRAGRPWRAGTMPDRRGKVGASDRASRPRRVLAAPPLRGDVEPIRRACQSAECR